MPQLSPLPLEVLVSNATDGTAHDVTQYLSAMPTFFGIDDAFRSLADDSGGYKWTLVFPVTMGNVGQMVINMDSTLTGLVAEASYDTLVNGNAIGGFFIIGNSALLSSSILAADMKTALELVSGMGSVSVTRTGPDNQLGYTWTITWLDVVGNQDDLTFSNSLTGSGAVITGSTTRDGNYLGGDFALEYSGVVSDPMVFNVDASVMETELEKNIYLGEVSVSQTTAANTEGGFTYQVTFYGVEGDIVNLPLCMLSSLSRVQQL